MFLTKLRGISSWIRQLPSWVWLILILLFALSTRLYLLTYTDKYIFDEVYHAVTAKLIARNDPAAFEWWNSPPEPDTAVDWLHPPVAKYTQALGMLVFGETPLGWRISSVVFGVGVIFLVYQLSWELFKDQAGALIAAFLASLDGLLLVQSRLAMNDIHVTFFIVLSLLWYWRYVQSNFLDWRKLWLAGVLGGVAMGTKWSGLFAVGLMISWQGCWLLYQSWLKLRLKKTGWQTFFKKWLISVTALGAVPLIMYVLSYSLMFAQGKSLVCTKSYDIQGECYLHQVTDKTTREVTDIKYISHFRELHRQIWNYQTTLTATHPFQSRPWQWVTNTRPVWFWVEYGSAQEKTVANVYAQGNFGLFWLGGLAVLTASISWLIVSWGQLSSRPQLVSSFHPQFTQAKLAWLFVIAGYFIVWLPWQISPRIMFAYHYTPAVVFLAVILAHVVRNNSQRIAITLLLATVFVIWAPNWMGIKVPTKFANQIYCLENIHSPDTTQSSCWYNRFLSSKKLPTSSN